VFIAPRHGVVGELGGGEDGPGRLGAGITATLGAEVLGFGMPGFAMLGAGFVVTGLSPAAPSSVAPSGIVLLPAVGPPVVAPACGVPPMPAELPAVEEAQALEFDITLPPSKVERDPATPLPEAAMPPHGDGLSPPGLSSVAPRGIPFDCVLNPELPVPSGDVAPIPGVGLTCANPTAQVLSQTSAAVAGILVSGCRIGLVTAVARLEARAAIAEYVARLVMAYLLAPLRRLVLDAVDHLLASDDRSLGANVSRGTVIRNCRSVVNTLSEEKTPGSVHCPAVTIVQLEASAARSVLKVRNARIVVVPRSRCVR
jgi:hypothetical protein